MGRRYFGTDGIRGTVGEAPITPDFVLRLGYAAGKVLASSADVAAGSRPTVLIGKDTRVSGYMLEAALEAGFSAAGVDVMLAGPMPTPGVAYLTRALRLSAGVVISASHNPYHDNGIKFSPPTATSCPTTPKPRSKRGSTSRSSAHRPTVSARRADLTTRPAATSSSARARSLPRSTCAG